MVMVAIYAFHHSTSRRNEASCWASHLLRPGFRHIRTSAACLSGVVPPVSTGATLFQGEMLSPLQHRTYRRVWTGSTLSYFGFMINSVGAGWAMTELSGNPEMVALVQAVMMLPYALFAMLAGAISDTFDRRKVGIMVLIAAVISSAALTTIAYSGWLTPRLLLLLCFLIGTANAMFGPVGQSSIAEQVPPKDLPSAIALNAIGFNIARSFGPALGGVLVAVWGAVTAFAANAVSYLPMLWALFTWKRVQEQPRLPPEQLLTAVISGVRYVAHSPTLRGVVIRAVIFGLAGGSITALMPLVSRDLLSGGPRTYGNLLGAFGIGAVTGAILMSRFRARFTPAWHVGGSTVLTGVMVLLLGFSRNEFFSIVLLFIGGIGWMQVLTTLNVTIQTRAPRWVAGRAVAGFQTASSAGIAGGAWLWGIVAEHHGVAFAISVSGAAMVVCLVLEWWSPLPPVQPREEDASARLTEPEVNLDLTGRSGPVVVEIEYNVDPDAARTFYRAMVEVRRVRMRNGGYGWSLSRDIRSPNLWVERYHCPTWDDYRRMRSRMTATEHEGIQQALSRFGADRPTSVRRLLERPFGSVRWTSDAPDPGVEASFNPGTSGH